MKQKKLATIALVAAMAIGTLGFSVPVKASEAPTTTTTDYVLTIPSTLTVANSGWNNAGGISATGSLASGKKLTVTASSENSFKLKSGNNEVGYKLATASADTEATTSWTFDSLSSTATKKDMGIIVEDYSSKPAGTYQDTVTFTAKVEDAVKEETLLTTITATGKTTYSQSVEGVVTVTPANIGHYDNTYGWLWNGTITVEPMEGYTITKCRFIQNSKTPLEDDLVPFSIVMNSDDFECCSVTTSTGQKGDNSMDGVTSIEVYGYEN